MSLSKSDRIREIAPGMDSRERAAIEGILGSVDGEVTVETLDGNNLGRVNFGGSSYARVIVELAGISRASGGELYRPTSVLTQHGDHMVGEALESVIQAGPYDQIIPQPLQQG